MGSGRFPEEGFGKSSYFRNIQVVDKENNLKTPKDLGTFTEQSNCYDVQTGSNSDWGHYFYYGGPDSPFDLEAFSDSDYAGASHDRKSTTGEYVAAANCYGQVLWIQNQMLDYGFNFMNTKIYIDNESIICIMKNLVFHSKTKHIEIRHHFIRDSYEKKLIQVIKIHTDQNVADLLTKAFDVSRFNFLIASIGLLNL
ncbi:putative ribonuclease H-like domain-containing protein [Tanacetum coccineum]